MKNPFDTSQLCCGVVHFGILEFFSAYAEKGKETIFKFRFLNTRFRKKRMEKKNGPVSVISSAIEMHSKFQYLAGRIYDILGVYGRQRETAMDHIKSLVSYKWNVVEIYPHVFFETYLLSDWGHAFGEGKIYNAWAGYCFGMRDHFSILYNGDVILCCVDYDGHTAIGNLHQASLKEVLSSKMLGEIIDGFKKYRVVHPYCKRCLGSQTITDWLFKPLVNIMVLHIFKPFFYKHTDLLE